MIAIVWLDDDPADNSRSIERGIEVAKVYPDTMVRMSCGSEVRTRHDYRLDGEILRCIEALHRAGVRQPVTTIDTWWEWCDRAWPCRRGGFKNAVDWIGVNVFPWWENRFSGLFPCTSAAQAADFQLARLEDVARAYSGREVILTEFGWPGGPRTPPPANAYSGDVCGIAGQAEKLQVIRTTLEKLTRNGRSGTVFEAFDEPWKAGVEGNEGAFWGLCRGTPPYNCPPDLKVLGRGD